MTFHCLPAGTDVAEMALFDIDALPRSQPPDQEGLQLLAAQERIVRLPTGGDGGYLLHLYVDESPPDRVMRYCMTDDKLSGHFSSAGGRIAFGGAESAFQDFKANEFIRADAVISPGRFLYTAYHTEFPDQMVEEAMRVEQTAGERWLGRGPVMATILPLGCAAILAPAGHFVMAGLVLVVGYLSFKAIKGAPAYKELVARRRERERDFPSIVIEMRPAAPL